MEPFCKESIGSWYKYMKEIRNSEENFGRISEKVFGRFSEDNLRGTSGEIS